MRILIVNRFFGGAQIPTGRMAEDVARVLVEGGHEVTALASTGEYVGAAHRADGIRYTAQGIREEGEAAAHSAESDTEPKHRNTASPKHRSTLRVEQVRVPKWIPRALAWVWFTWQARQRIPQMDWDACLLMTDPPLLPLLARRAAGMRHTADGKRGEAEGGRHTADGKRRGSHEDAQKDSAGQARDRNTDLPKHRAKRRIAVWLMDLYPEALAASGRVTKSSAIYKWYFSKRQQSLAAADLLICLGQAQKELLDTGRIRQTANSIRKEEGEGEGEVGASVGQCFSEAGKTEKPNYPTTEPLRPPLTQGVRTVVVPPWDDRGNIALATEESLENLALYAGNLGEAHCFEEILAAAPYLPGDWTIRFAARGAKLSALQAAASGIRHTADGIRTEVEGPVEYAGSVNLSSDSATSRAEHSTGQGGLKLTNLKLKTAGAGVRSTEGVSAGQCFGRAVDASHSGAAVEITGYASEEETPGLLASARVHLITMSPGWEGIVVPSKLYGCIRTGRPVLFIGPENADTAREIRAHDWGKVLPPGASGQEVAAAILELAARPTRAPQSENGVKKVAELIQGLATAERSETDRSKS